MLNLKSLLNKIVSEGIFKSGVTMTGQLKTSFKNFIACGSYDSSKTTISELINEVKMSSGAMGSFTLSSTDSNYGVSIVSGSYRFIYMPHRYGGVNGAAPTASGETDNCKYGILFLFGTRCYAINLNNNNITAAYQISQHNYGYGQAITFQQTSNSYYTLNLNSSWGYWSTGNSPKIVTLTIYIDCKSGVTPPTSWQLIGNYTRPATSVAPGNDYNFSLTNSAGTVVQGYINSSGNIYTKGGYAGHGFKGTISFIY